MRCDGLGDLLEKQSSVASRGQLLTLGMNDNVMQYRVRRGGPWQTLLPGVYLAASGIPSVSQKEMAALLYAGPGSLVTGPMALLHHSIRGGSAVDSIDTCPPTTGTAPGNAMTGWRRPASSSCTSPHVSSGVSRSRWRK